MGLAINYGVCYLHVLYQNVTTYHFRTQVSNYARSIGILNLILGKSEYFRNGLIFVTPPFKSCVDSVLMFE